MPGGRPKETLLDRVIARTWRPGRYAHLLLGEELPLELPEALGRAWSPEYANEIWRTLRKWQREYAFESTDPELQAYNLTIRPAIADEFAELMHHLHGARRPAWFREDLEVLGWKFDGPGEPIDAPQSRHSRATR